MREIKFRAWDKLDGMIHFDFDDLYYNRLTIDHGVYNVPMMQYTGLHDKNGKEIYEGDILDGSYVNPMSQEKVEKHYEVTFRKANCYAELIGHHPYGTTMLYFENEKSEVIGNIYENPELLEVNP